MSAFLKKLEAQWAKGKFVCVGLDPHLDQMPHHFLQEGISQHLLFKFCAEIVYATASCALAFKPNIAFFERYGAKGLEVLARLSECIRTYAPEAVLILDYKRGDIEGTNAGYIDLAFKQIDADAVTINPYLGQQANQPFLDRADRGIIVLCKTSNKGAGEFQDLVTIPPELLNQQVGVWDHTRENERLTVGLFEDWRRQLLASARPLYQHVAYNVKSEWNTGGNCGLVVGATYPDDLAKVRAIVGDMPILIPGIGAQGGELEATIRAGMDRRGYGMIVNSSRGIIHASRQPDFAEIARAKTIELHDAINAVREKVLAQRAAA